MLPCRHPNGNLKAYAVDPGFAKTGLQRWDDAVLVSLLDICCTQQDRPVTVCTMRVPLKYEQGWQDTCTPMCTFRPQHLQLVLRCVRSVKNYYMCRHRKSSIRFIVSNVQAYLPASWSMMWARHRSCVQVQVSPNPDLRFAFWVCRHITVGDRLILRMATHVGRHKPVPEAAASIVYAAIAPELSANSGLPSLTT